VATVISVTTGAASRGGTSNRASGHRSAPVGVGSTAGRRGPVTARGVAGLAPGGVGGNVTRGTRYGTGLVDLAAGTTSVGGAVIGTLAADGCAGVVLVAPFAHGVSVSKAVDIGGGAGVTGGAPGPTGPADVGPGASDDAVGGAVVPLG